MLRASKRLIFAIEAVLDIAYNAGGAPVQSRDITERQGISRRYLEPVLQQLVRAGLLVGVRGPRGGYRLARERRRISLGDITRVVLAMADSEEDEGGGSELGRQVVRPIWDELQQDMLDRLDEISIEELCLRARKAGLASESVRSLDFSI
ncbi:MAG: Rrf2 family transcriptional regulator [Alphaproteobacteria bacterium]|nr:Rrf2 family transcriptional regulator [Alphaproteobacteria bacterium]